MREFNPPSAVEIPDSASLTDVVFDRVTERPETPVLSRKIAGEWNDVTARQFRDDVVELAKGLVAHGIQPGDRVCLMSRTRYEWTLCDYALWAAGAVTVPIYETSSPEQARWVLRDSGARAIFVETAEHEQTVGQVAGEVPTLEDTWRIDDGALDRLRASGADVRDDVIEHRRRAGGPDALATVIYTSGTTGPPKGCELTHRNLLFDVRSAIAGGLDDLFLQKDSCTLLFLPLAHVFARVIQVGCIENGVRLGHTANIGDVLTDLATFQPTFILSVPRVFEKVYNSATQKATAEGRGKIFDKAAATAVTYSEALDSGGPGPGLRLKHAAFDKLVYAKLRDALGGRVAAAVSGGAPLGAWLGHFFRGIGVPVLEGYGMTETSAVATFNIPHQMKVGTVGKPFPGCAVRIADDDEIMIRGAHVFRGYWNNPAATAETIETDGWLHTGDAGSLDDDGFLRITGRKKELIVTASGKNVAPAILEDRVRLHPLISQCVVVGDQRPYVSALVTLDEEALDAWKKQQGKPADASVREMRDDPDLVARVQAAIDDANGAVSRAESIRRFRVLPGDFTEESGYMTPTLKTKRDLILRDFSEDVEALYA